MAQKESRTPQIADFFNDIDPSATSAGIPCCSSEAGLSPYQNTRLSRYDAAF
jgi:hypothetical protein